MRASGWLAPRSLWCTPSAASSGLYVLHVAAAPPYTALGMTMDATSMARTSKGSHEAPIRSHIARQVKGLFTLLCRGHAADPLQASILRIIKSAKRMLARYPQRREQLTTTLRLRETPNGNRANVTGPGKQLLWALQMVGWSMDDNFHVTTRGGRQ